MSKKPAPKKQVHAAAKHVTTTTPKAPEAQTPPAPAPVPAPGQALTKLGSLRRRTVYRFPQVPTEAQIKDNQHLQIRLPDGYTSTDIGYFDLDEAERHAIDEALKGIPKDRASWAPNTLVHGALVYREVTIQVEGEMIRLHAGADGPVLLVGMLEPSATLMPVGGVGSVVPKHGGDDDEADEDDGSEDGD